MSIPVRSAWWRVLPSPRAGEATFPPLSSPRHAHSHLPLPLALSPPTGPPPPSELSWSAYFARFARLAPFLWPSKSGKLQLLAGACLVMLVLGRAVNVAVPQVLGRVVGCLSAYTGSGGDPQDVCMGGSGWTWGRGGEAEQLMR